MDLRSAAALGLDAYMDAHRLDAVLFAGRTGAAIAAKAGYPSVQVPAGFTAGLNGKDTPDYPLGATFTGRAWSEPILLRLATPSSRRPRRAVRLPAMPLDPRR
jgi:amidase